LGTPRGAFPEENKVLFASQASSGTPRGRELRATLEKKMAKSFFAKILGARPLGSLLELSRFFWGKKIGARRWKK
jgi:hypothetical protein